MKNRLNKRMSKLTPLVTGLILAAAFPFSPLTAEKSDAVSGENQTTGTLTEQQMLLAQSIKFKKSERSEVKAEETRAQVKERESRNQLNENIGSINPRAPYVLDAGRWYFKLSSNLNYYTLGPEFNKVIQDIEDIFGGRAVSTKVLIFDSNIAIKTERPVQRAKTNIIPTGNIGLGYLLGNHQFELDFGLAGLVPLNTINQDTPMVLSEKQTCTTAELDKCPMAKLGFVNQSTGQGKYNFNIIMNENVWLITPSVYYDYIFKTEKWGRLSAGVSAGLMMLSAKQHIEFYAKRTDVPDNAGTILKPYASRTLEGVAESNAINNIGPVLRLYVGFKRQMVKNIFSEMRVGVNWGYVNLTRDVDGNASASLGGAMVSSFPTSALGFPNQETNKFDLTGFFVQAGLVF